MTCKASNVYHLALHRKIVLTSALENSVCFTNVFCFIEEIFQGEKWRQVSPGVSGFGKSYSQGGDAVMKTHVESLRGFSVAAIFSSGGGHHVAPSSVCPQL